MSELSERGGGSSLIGNFPQIFPFFLVTPPLSNQNAFVLIGILVGAITLTTTLAITLATAFATTLSTTLAITLVTTIAITLETTLATTLSATIAA